MRIGNVQIAGPLCQAGLAGYSDRAMRVVARRRGCNYAITEALLDTILVNGGLGLKRSIDVNDEDHPVAGQIIGSDPDTMAPAARLLEEAGYDVIDLNFACPVKKVKNKARGGHMLRDVERGVGILNAVRDALRPETAMTISLRRGFDDSAQSVETFYELVEAAWGLGYAAVRVHGRTVEQKYQGRARWGFVADVKKRYPDKVILGAGDLFTAQDVVQMLHETKADMAWVARGAIGNPWIFEHAAALLADPCARLAPPTVHEQREALAEHFAMAMEIHGEQLAARRMRKMGIKYSRFHPQALAVKARFINVHSSSDWQQVLEEWYGEDGAGVWPDPRSADEVNDGQASGS